MRKISLIILLTGMCISLNAHAWFFFFLPGSVTGKISDAMTGSEGENCVGSNAKVGDKIRLPNGSVMAIKSLSGTSVRCTTSEFPIRALLEPSTTSIVESTTEAKLDLPDGWAQVPLTDTLKAKQIVLYAANRTTDSSLSLATTKRAGITDMSVFVNSRRAAQASNLEGATQSEITQLTINGVPAWQFEVSGKVKSGMALTYFQTIYESAQEVVLVSASTTSSSYLQKKDDFQKIAGSLTGLSPTTPVQVAATPTNSPNTTSQVDQTKSVNAAPNSEGSDADIAKKLSTLKSLLDQRLITQEDYEIKKKEILKSM